MPTSASVPDEPPALAALRRALPDRYLTPDDLAHLLQLPKETIYRWRKTRTGPPAIRVGKHLRYDPVAVAAWLADRADPTTQTA